MKRVFGPQFIPPPTTQDAPWLIPFEVGAAKGIYGTGTVNKFGINEDIDDVELTVYQAHSVGGPIRAALSQANLSSVYISSGNVLDVGQLYTVQGLDANWDFQSVDVNLGAIAGGGGGSGTETVLVGEVGNWVRVFRAFNASSSPTSGIVYIHKDSDAGSDGVPDGLPFSLLTVVTAGFEQTLMAFYTVPRGHDAFITYLHLSNMGKGTDPVTFKLRIISPPGTTSRVEYVHALQAFGSIPLKFEPPIRVTEMSDIEVTAVSNPNAGQGVTANFGILQLPNDYP